MIAAGGCGFTSAATPVTDSLIDQVLHVFCRENLDAYFNKQVRENILSEKLPR